MSATRLDRRHFLKAMGAAASAVPFIPLLDAHAASTPPKRIVFFFSSNGTIHESWLPKMAGSKLELSPILAPLEKLKSKVLVIDGLSHKVIIEKSDRGGHSAGMNTALTGRNNKIVDPADPLHSMATGISLDQYLAGKIGAETKLRSIECGIQVEPYYASFASLSYKDPHSPIMPENSPYRVFDRLFRSIPDPGASDGATTQQSLEDRQRVLESASKDLEALRKRLPADDRVKMEAHIEAVREVGHSLTTGAGITSGRACQKPELGAPLDIEKNSNIPAIGKMQMDLVAMALACDLTRVATIQFGKAGANHRFTWLGREFATDPLLNSFCQARGFHALAHREADPESRAKLVRINTWYAEQFAYFLHKLASIPEGGGSVLDRTVVVWVNELGSGGTHAHDKTPWVLGGNAGGFLKTGQLLSYPGEPHNRLLLTLCHAMGVATDSFGDPDYCKAGSLSGAIR
ncbi:MAG TPA: DUF1552 domain-containing protein [Polyangium sp.]|nr:DUF1552 domain-containing protein [Polyangium sp.]